MSESNADSSGINNQRNEKIPEEVATTPEKAKEAKEDVAAAAEEVPEAMKEVEVSPTTDTRT